MCDGKPVKLTKIERLIDAIDRLERRIATTPVAHIEVAAASSEDKLKSQIDRLEKLIG